MVKVVKYPYAARVSYTSSQELAVIRKFIEGTLAHTDYARKDENGRYLIKNVYAANIDNEITIHINVLDNFLNYLNQNGIRSIDVENYFPYEPLKLDLKVNKGWVPRDHQPEIIEFAVKDREYNAALLGIQMGVGKTACGLFSVAKIGELSALITKPSYIAQWLKVVPQILNIKKEEICVVRGQSSLNKLIDSAQAGEHKYKFIMFSSTTYANYIKLYNLDPEAPLACVPQDLMSTLKVGPVIIDEVHEHNYTYYNLMMYSNNPKIIALSATLLSDDKFITGIYSIEFPRENIYDELEWHKYIDYVKIEYTITTANRIRTSEYGSNSYSHHAYEKSILASIPTYNNYVDLIAMLINVGYFEKKGKGDKLLIFVSGVALAKDLCERFRKRYRKAIINSYTQDDDYETLLTSDIIIATPGKAATAVDIPGLLTTINTTNIKSIVTAVQALGRLRFRKGIVLTYFQLVNIDLKKHREYHQSRMRVLENKVKVIRTLAYKNSL